MEKRSNWKNVIISPNPGQKRWWMVSQMQNEGKTDNGKTMITFSLDDFSAPSKSLDYAKANNEKFWNCVFIFWLFYQFATQHSRTHAS